MGAFLSALSFLVYIVGLNVHTVSQMGRKKPQLYSCSPGEWWEGQGLPGVVSDVYPLRPLTLSQAGEPVFPGSTDPPSQGLPSCCCLASWAQPLSLSTGSLIFKMVV